jgi:hypothetical protein
MSEESQHIEVKEDPGVASAEEGQVILEGPDGVAVTMTPQAAKETAASLIAAAERAGGQADETSED